MLLSLKLLAYMSGLVCLFCCVPFGWNGLLIWACEV